MSRKFCLAVLLALAALAGAATTASAADNTFEGSCDIKGVAAFDQTLTGTPAANGYHFKSGDPTGGTAPDTSNCSGTLNGVKVDVAPITAFVNGTGTLSCGGSNSDPNQPGIGGLVFTDGNVSLGFTLAFIGTASEVTLGVNGSKSGKAGGNASFRDYVDPVEAGQECSGTDADGNGVAGYNSLGFHAMVQTFSPLVSEGAPPNPAAGGSGGGTGGGGAGTTGTGSTTPISVALRALAQRLRIVLSRGLKVALSASAPVRASLVAQVDAATAKRVHLARSGRPVVIGRKVVNLTRPGRTVAKIPLTRKAKRRLSRVRRVRVQIVGTIRDVTGRTRSLSSRVTLR